MHTQDLPSGLTCLSLCQGKRAYNLRQSQMLGVPQIGPLSCLEAVESAK